MQTSKTPKKTPLAGALLDKAKRTISARKFAGLTREEMSTRHHIPSSTLRGWESPGSIRNQGLTLKGAKRLVKALQKEGVICSIEWLMEGAGVGPRFYDLPTTKGKRKIPLWGDQIVIQKEIQFFEEMNPDAVVVMIPNDTLLPFFEQGDYVGGIKMYQREMTKLINHICIVETTHKEMLVAKLTQGKMLKSFSLSAVNPAAKSHDLPRDNITLNWSAAIIWHRKLIKI